MLRTWVFVISLRIRFFVTKQDIHKGAWEQNGRANTEN